MEKSKGQALVEFVLVLPILLIILLAIVDFGNIIYQKYLLESKLDNVVELYSNKKEVELSDYVAREKLKVNYETTPDYVVITINQDIKINAPVLSSILKSPYNITSERTVYNE